VLENAVARAGANPGRVRAVLASGESIDGIRFTGAGEPGAPR